MGALEIVLGLVVLAWVGFQVWLTVRVAKSKMFEPRQKMLQAQLIWLLPIIGAGLVFSFLQEESRDNRPPSSQIKKS